MSNLLEEIVPGPAASTSRLKDKQVTGKSKVAAATLRRGPGRPPLPEPRNMQCKGAVTEREKDMIDRWCLETYHDTTSNVVRDILLELAERDGFSLLPDDLVDEDAFDPITNKFKPNSKIARALAKSAAEMKKRRDKMKAEGTWQQVSD